MKKSSKAKKQLIDGNHQLLSIKEVMDSVLSEAVGLPPEVKQAITQARDISWQAFIKEQENRMVKADPVGNKQIT